MLPFIIAFVRKWFNIPDVSNISKSFSHPILQRLDRLDKKFTYYVWSILALIFIGFIIVMSCMEHGFHWKYLFKF
jgi:hypothetical protein